jgi:hypothetical protein
MAHCFVELGAYGAIGDFDCDGMTEEEICDAVQEIVEEFVSTEVGWVVVDNKADYWNG